jgi:hypothetical protein
MPWLFLSNLIGTFTVYPYSQGHAMKKTTLITLTSTALAILLTLLPAAARSEADTGATPLPTQKSLKGFDNRDVALTRWVDPSGSRPTSYQQWKQLQGDPRDFDIHLQRTSSAPATSRDMTGMLVVINTDLYPQIAAAVDQYVLDLNAEGYSVSVYTTAGGTPEDLRSFLQARYSEGMAGCLLIGDLPVPWYEHEEEQFPVDLFYMDMDGIFTDTNSNDMYDLHSGDVAPEIWMGRLTASPLTMGGADEATLVQDYFAKNHLYRTGALPVNNRALVYIDDDWAGGADWWDMNVGQAFSDHHLVKDEWITLAADYEAHLPQNYEFIQVCVHSWPGGHAFKNPDEVWDYTYVSELETIEPVALFYNLFACSNARYIESDYMAGWYIFLKDYGLGALGSAKTGSMLNFEDFYGPFGQGRTIGAAFQQWFIDQAAGGFEDWEISWFYGMTLQGDPTLTIQQISNSTWLQYDNGAASYMMGLPDESLDRFNVRFTAAKACTLATVAIDGDFSGSTADVMLYVWESDGTWPTTPIDSVLVPYDSLPVVNVKDHNITFAANQQFHIGVSMHNPGAEDLMWIYMDNGDPTQNRSGLANNGSWQTLANYWGLGYNFLIRAETHGPPMATMAINTSSLPSGTAGQPYAATLEVDGGLAPYSWTVTSGELPDGLSLDASSALISGVPTVGGEFEFVVEVADSDEPQQVTDKLFGLNFTVNCGDLDNNTSGPDISDLTFAVEFFFGGGPAPRVIAGADVDSSGVLDISDLTYLVDYLFGGGPAPSCLL